MRVDLVAHDAWWDGDPVHGKVSFVVTGGRRASIAAFNNNDADRAHRCRSGAQDLEASGFRFR